MELYPITCGECGADLDVAEEARFVTCRACKKKLVVKRTDTTVYTEVLDKVARAAEATHDSVAVLKLKAQLETLDGEWRRRYPDGSPESARNLGLYLGGLFLLFGFGALFIASSMDRADPSMINELATVLIVMGFAVGAIGWFGTGAKVEAYRREHDEHEKKRTELTRGILAQGGAPPAEG